MVRHTNRLVTLLLMAIVFVFFKAQAIEPVKGYRGFVDINGEALFEKKHSNDRDIVYSVSGVTTTHGYQFNKHFFVGGGTGICLMTSNYNWFAWTLCLPVYITGQADWNIGKVPLFADLRVGSFAKHFDRLFINPSVGYHLSWGRKVSLNIGAGVSVHVFDNFPGSECKFLPSVRIGIEFN